MVDKGTRNEKNIPVNQEVPDSSRRKFLRNTGMVTGGVVGGAVLGGFLGNPFKTEKAESTTTKPVEAHGSASHTEAMQFFTRKEDFDTLAAATEVIFPEDESGPGAIGLGAPYYIDKQLATPWGRNIDDYRKRPFADGATPLTRGDIMIQGIRKLNEVSQVKHKDKFKQLDEEKQIEVLQAFESGEVEMTLVSSAEFFATLRQLTMEGCFADPVYGGNKNMEGWKMKEFPGAYMSYADVIESEEFVLKEPKSLSDHM
ncbi:gluconate 2-dehydrogenase subunit 3 family protein [Oceanobacillus saliphilus]|uniref:gluconate 2-dehydrogenase subunit 3 family protein n=1 Tax=Oceanobacillus saliphilus TaxID=2925834 RepID=UPI00201DE611|nr:gluconate 2-dehydrogenase subunit 3 family protein [Oceanobacillus saliphilus]